MGNSKGWICLYRDVEDHWIWSKPEWFQWWCWILMHVNIEDKKMYLDGDIVTCHRGEIHTSIRKLSETLNATPKRIKTFLDLLEREHMVETKRNTNGTTLKVTNYAKYQDFLRVSGNTKGHTDETPLTTSPTTPPTTLPKHERPTTKQYNNITSNNYSSSSYSSNSTELFESFWNRYPKKRKRRETEELFEEMRIDQGELNQILKGLDKWIECEDWKKNDGQYIQSPDKFLQNQQWKEKPRTSKPINQYSGHKSDAEVSYDADQWKTDVMKPPVYRRNY